MSNLWFNIRFGIRHWQWGPDGMNFRVNPYQIDQRENDKDWRWFEVYCVFGSHLG
jgi:hypothetical protein